MLAGIIPLRNKRLISHMLLNGLAILFIYLVPTLSHLTSVPVYMIEPMRLMLILAVVHTSSFNAYFLAATLPLISYLFSGHPFFLKMLIITGELVLNTLLFYLFIHHIRKVFPSILLSILLSKLACYLAYGIFFTRAFMTAEASPLFLAVQVGTTIFFSLYVTLFLKQNV